MFGAYSENPVFAGAWEVVTRRTFDRAMAATELAERTLRQEGELRRVEDELWAGNIALSQDRQLLSRISRASGLGLAVYAGNRRIAAATVLDSGTAPDIGDFAPAPLAESVLRRGEIYRGKVDYDGRQYITVGRPILSDSSAEFAPIGMIEAFQDEGAFFDLLSAAARRSADAEAREFESRSDGMESIIQFIDNVARKLQLLALNGNIIAAQAGRQGSAFRVVCSELGDLADRAKHQTAQVRKLVQAMGLGEDTSSSDASYSTRFNNRMGPGGDDSDRGLMSEHESELTAANSPPDGELGLPLAEGSTSDSSGAA